jgi:hypothetical protein
MVLTSFEKGWGSKVFNEKALRFAKLSVYGFANTSSKVPAKK